MPVQQYANPDMRGNQIKVDADTVKLIADNVKSTLGLNKKQTAEVSKLIEEYSMQEFPNREELYEEIKDRFGTYTETEADESIREAKAWVKRTPILVSQTIKGDVADYSKWMKGYFGKIRFSNNGLPVDTAYQELSGLYPGLFPEDIINPTDQLMRIAEVADMSHKVKMELPVGDDVLYGITDDIIEYIGAYQHVQKQTIAEEQAGESFDSLVNDIAPVLVPETMPVTAPLPSSAST